MRKKEKQEKPKKPNRSDLVQLELETNIMFYDGQLLLQKQQQIVSFFLDMGSSQFM